MTAFGEAQPPIVIQLDWPGFATRLATALPARHLESHAGEEEWMDEFVLRDTLKAHFGRLIPGLNVQLKEVKYPDDQRRLDLRLGDAAELSVAVEIKSDPGNLSGVRDDWVKICTVQQRYKLVVFAGVTPRASGLKKFEDDFGEEPHVLSNGQTAYHLTHQDAEFGVRNGRKAAFVWIWYIDQHPPRQVRLVID